MKSQPHHNEHVSFSVSLSASSFLSLCFSFSHSSSPLIVLLFFSPHFFLNTLSSSPSLFSLIPSSFKHTQIEKHTLSNKHTHAVTDKFRGTTPWRSRALMHYEVTPCLLWLMFQLDAVGKNPFSHRVISMRAIWHFEQHPPHHTHTASHMHGHKKPTQ